MKYSWGKLISLNNVNYKIILCFFVSMMIITTFMASEATASATMKPGWEVTIRFTCNDFPAQFSLGVNADITTDNGQKLVTDSKVASEALEPYSLIVDISDSEKIRFYPTEKQANKNGFVITWTGGNSTLSQVTVEMSWAALGGHPKGPTNAQIRWPTGYVGTTSVAYTTVGE